ncbi:hypothetical protein ACQP1S_16460 [Micromonospora matsumotoense]|uniref:hypothetical protein n=1 Tax=Micromonospora matsumotoense TaxID=121616 RepID=UPI003D932B45
MLELRLNLANLYVLAGAYREALPEFTGLVVDLAERPKPDQELIWYCRQQAAMCHAELGEAGTALAEMRLLLVEQQRNLATDDLSPLRQ